MRALLLDKGGLRGGSNSTKEVLGAGQVKKGGLYVIYIYIYVWLKCYSLEMLSVCVVM